MEQLIGDEAEPAVLLVSTPLACSSATVAWTSSHMK
jgi:hypothetical protein